eukprot:4270693-Pyramimonas_sp.AAC.1
MSLRWNSREPDSVRQACSLPTPIPSLGTLEPLKNSCRRWPHATGAVFCDQKERQAQACRRLQAFKLSFH